MAYTKKTTTKSVKTESNDEVKTKSFAPEDEIECVSVTAGELIMTGKKTGRIYDWANYGDTAYVEYQDLKAEAHNAKSRLIFDPLFMIEDEDVLALPEFAKVAESYKDAISVDEIDNLFNLSQQQFATQLRKLPTGIKNTIKSIARDKMEDGTLDSINKIKLIDEILGTDLYNLLGNG